jgi:hypothetical protein
MLRVTFFSIRYSLILLSFGATWSELLTASLNKVILVLKQLSITP